MPDSGCFGKLKAGCGTGLADCMIQEVPVASQLCTHMLSAQVAPPSPPPPLHRVISQLGRGGGGLGGGGGGGGTAR